MKNISAFLSGTALACATLGFSYGLGVTPAFASSPCTQADDYAEQHYMVSSIPGFLPMYGPFAAWIITYQNGAAVTSQQFTQETVAACKAQYNNYTIGEALVKLNGGNNATCTGSPETGQIYVTLQCGRQAP